MFIVEESNENRKPVIVQLLGIQQMHTVWLRGAPEQGFKLYSNHRRLITHLRFHQTK